MKPSKSMIYLFSDAGNEKLRGFVRRDTLFAFDLDGTLAPITADPSNIAIPAAVRCRLIDLHRMAPLAIITGRARADAIKHLGFTPGFLVGNHGAEGLPGCQARERQYVRLCREWKRCLLEILRDKNGIVIEDKGTTLSLHYRNSHDPERAHKEILLAMNGLTPSPRAVGGKFVENIAPQDAPNKGEALLSVMWSLGCPQAVFFGDDETDEDVFRLRNDRVLGIRIGPSTRSAASHYLHDQDELGPALVRILESLVT